MNIVAAIITGMNIVAAAIIPGTLRTAVIIIGITQNVVITTGVILLAKRLVYALSARQDLPVQQVLLE
jgi:hypothetical protein